MSHKYEKIKTLLKELFQLDQPDLDFGFYRVMHAKSAEVTQFLDKDLLPQVQAAFGLYKTADKAEIEKELAKVIAGIEAAGMDPAQSPKVKDLRARLKSDAVDVSALESEVYDHLFGFFRRYYSEGDFLAKRVYKPGVYAIPYEGEEVTLHWANKDQYYIKTSEYLRDYAFRLRPDDDKKPMRVHFRLMDVAEGEHGNVKAAEAKERVFILAAPGESGRDFIAEEDGEQGKELVIRFEYRPATLTDWPDDARDGKSKPPAQKDLSALAAKSVLAVTDAAMAPWIAELGKTHVLASGEKADYTRLEAHIKRYTARNTFDYFIHKDLGTFLRRELDFYIKNEVMHLDDVENETAPRVEQYLSKIKVIRKIAGKIIDFLAQLEDFQKKLWLKKKFVVETQYCITLGCIPEAFYPEIAANEAEHEEWVKLLAIDEIEGDMVTPGYSKKLKPEFLKANPTLVVDTQHFDAGFTARLIEAIGDVDEQTDGVLFHSENFQALSLMRQRYREQVKCIYIDPPYNTEEDRQSGRFVYKDNYDRSTWASLLYGGLTGASALMSRDGVIFTSIDHNEIASLKTILEEIIGRSNFEGLISWRRRHNQPNDKTKMIGMVAEYLLAYAKDSQALRQQGVGKLDLTGSFSNPDNDQRGDWASKPWKVGSGQSGTRYVITSPSGKAFDEEWMGDEETYKRLFADKRIIFPKGGDGFPRKKYFRSEREEEGQCATNWWEHEQFGHNASASDVLAALFGSKNFFTNPKPPELVRGVVQVSGRFVPLVLDYFGGSGTTGHAVVNLNREDGGRRKFILVEMADYFDTVLLPRIKKVTFTPEWKDGKPKRLATAEEAERSPRIVKVVRLESYEDTLNNLETRRTDTQQLLLDATDAQGADGLKEQYILRYMLNVETRGSQSLLNVQAFTDPTAYRLKVKRPGSDESREVNVDLLETFNWLIGLTVRHIAAPQTFSAAFERDSEKRLRLKGRLRQEAAGLYWFRTVIGTTPDGRKTLIIWRKLTGNPEQDNLVLDEWFTRQGYSAKDSEFDLIYVNGGNNLENLKAPDDLWKVRLIEEDFHRLMFEAEGV
jgi:adenine-specific DNA-methyltransferase